jgi:hypothetical protein
VRVDGIIVRVHAIIDGTKIEPGPIKASEADKLKGWTGYGLREWEGQVAAGDPLACRGLLALMRFRQGEHVKIADVDIDDVDTIEGSLRTEDGRELTVALDENGEPIKERGRPRFLLDGEPLDPPTAASPTG